MSTIWPVLFSQLYFSSSSCGSAGVGWCRPHCRGWYQVDIPRTVAVYLPHAGRVADRDLLLGPAGHGLQRRDAEPPRTGSGTKRPAVGHQAFGFAIADIAQVDYVGQVGQTRRPASSARLPPPAIATWIRLGLAAAAPREVSFFSRFAMPEIVPALLQLRVPGKHAVIGRDALHLLPGVVDNIHLFRRHTVVFVDLRLGKFRYRNNALGLFGQCGGTAGSATRRSAGRGGCPL